jgi:hypothetical protein
LAAQSISGADVPSTSKRARRQPRPGAGGEDDDDVLVDEVLFRTRKKVNAPSTSSPPEVVTIDDDEDAGAGEARVTNVPLGERTRQLRGVLEELESFGSPGKKVEEKTSSENRGPSSSSAGGPSVPSTVRHLN